MLILYCKRQINEKGKMWKTASVLKQLLFPTRERKIERQC